MPAKSKSRSKAPPTPSPPPPPPPELVAPPAGLRFDAHLHLSRYWPDLAKNSYASTVDFTVPGLLRELDAQQIGHGLVLQVNEAPSVEETLREGEELFQQSGGRLLRSSTLDPTKGREAVREAVWKWERVDLAAIKLYPGYQRFYPHDPNLEPLYEYASRKNVVVMFHQGDTLDAAGLIKFSRPVELDEVAVRYRDVRFVLCHLGNPWIEEAAEIVYKNENVYADTSGLLWSPRLPKFDALVARARDRVAHAIAEIGDVSRILYGSDWPLESIELAVQFIERLDLPPDEREAVLGGNARRLFRLDAREP